MRVSPGHGDDSARDDRGSRRPRPPHRVARDNTPDDTDAVFPPEHKRAPQLDKANQIVDVVRSNGKCLERSP